MNRKNDPFPSKMLINYLSADCERGLLEATPKGERAVLAFEPRRNAERHADDDRNMDLAAVAATEAISLSERF